MRCYDTISYEFQKHADIADNCIQSREENHKIQSTILRDLVLSKGLVGKFVINFDNRNKTFLY